MEEKKKIVVALGHDALGYTTEKQRAAVQKTSRVLADLCEAGYQLVITHSNGPQVSMIHKAMTELHRLYIDYTTAPMSVCAPRRAYLPRRFNHGCDDSYAGFRRSV